MNNCRTLRDFTRRRDELEALRRWQQKNGGDWGERSAEEHAYCLVRIEEIERWANSKARIGPTIVQDALRALLPPEGHPDHQTRQRGS